MCDARPALQVDKSFGATFRSGAKANKMENRPGIQIMAVTRLMWQVSLAAPPRAACRVWAVARSLAGTKNRISTGITSSSDGIN